MNRPNKNIPVTVIGTYTNLGDNMSFNWEKYAKDMELYADKLEQKNAELKKLLNRVLAYETFLISSLVSEITKALEE